MWDVGCIAASVGFFLIAIAYTTGCELLGTLRGVGYKAMSAESLLRRNLILYGVGGLIAPFLGIKLIDIIITAMHLA